MNGPLSADTALRGRLTVGERFHQGYQLPDGGCTNQDVDDPGESRVLAAEDRRDEVELEKADQAPVDPADDDQQKRDDVDCAHWKAPDGFLGSLTEAETECSGSVHQHACFQGGIRKRFLRFGRGHDAHICAVHRAFCHLPARSTSARPTLAPEAAHRRGYVSNSPALGAQRNDDWILESNLSHGRRNRLQMGMFRSDRGGVAWL